MGYAVLTTETRRASGAIGAARLVAFHATDSKLALPATDPTQPIMGVSQPEVDVLDGQRVDIHKLGEVPVIYGGNVRMGRPLTTDALSRAVEAAPGAGVVHYTFGVAQVPGVLGDTGSALLCPGLVKG